MLVSDILKAKGSSVISVSPQTDVAEAVRILSEKRIGSVLVMDRDKIAGILSERDIVRALAREGGDCLAGPVSKLMTSNVVTCSPHETLAEVMQMMTDGRFRHLPVVVDGRLAGMVSIGDVVKWRLEETEEEVRQMTAYVAGG